MRQHEAIDKIKNFLKQTLRLAKRIASMMPVVVVVVILIFITYDRVSQNLIGFDTKSLWDWMQLLMVPIILAIGGSWLNQAARQRDEKIADQRVKTEREIAAARAEDDALQIYFDRMSALILDRDLAVQHGNTKVSDIARTHTLTVLRRVNGTRKSIVVQFLYDSALITGEPPAIKMWDADLSAIDLRFAKLDGINLRGATLERADFTKAKLDNANLSDAVLETAILNDASLDKANLNQAWLKSVVANRAKFSEANLAHANFSGANLFHANFEGADLTCSDLSSADLVYADLTHANLTDADLSDARLGLNRLTGADLTRAFLTHADMLIHELVRAKSLKGAVMPDGNRYDGRWKLAADIEAAKADGIDVDDQDAMHLWYEAQKL